MPTNNGLGLGEAYVIAGCTGLRYAAPLQASYDCVFSMRKYQIFISSTFEDLKDARRVVIEQLLNLGHIPVGMELFQAGNTSQWDYIKRRITECDYYLLIVGDRYGSCLSDGMSYTEREYRFALDNNIPLASFLLSKDARSKLTRPNFETDQDKIVRLEAFRNLVQNKLVKFWSEGYELAAQISGALPELIRECPRPGLVPGSGAVPDSLRSVKLPPSGSQMDKGQPLYQTLRDSLADVRVEAAFVHLWKGDDYVTIPFQELFPDQLVVIWEIEDVFRLIFQVRAHLMADWGMLIEDFEWMTFASDLSSRVDVSPLNAAMSKHGATWFTIGYKGANWITRLKEVGLIDYRPMAPGKDNIMLTLTGRLLMAALVRLPEVETGLNVSAVPKHSVSLKLI